MTATRVDTLVVGGGAMGSAAAWQLARRGVEVVLLERFEPGHTRGASHGSSRIFRTSYADPLYVSLALEAEAQWRELEDESRSVLLLVTGGVEHGAGPWAEATAETLDTLGLPYAWLAPEEAAERWPGLRFSGKALFHPGSGRLHADRSVAALRGAAAARGAEVRHGTAVTHLEVQDDDRVLVTTDAEQWSARRVVVAAGAWAADLLGDLVPLPPIRVTQEQPAHFLPYDSGLDWPAFTHVPGADEPGSSQFGGIYGLSSGDEGVKVGFHGTGPEVHPDRRDFLPELGQLAALREYARAWVPGVDVDAATPISCTYATTPDSNFVIDRIGPVVVAAGFSGHGFKFVPAVGRLLADLADDRSAPALFSFRHHSTQKGVS
ncbi:MAG: FAD-dependent oxidoreductase [Aeromicrobium sp.]